MMYHNERKKYDINNNSDQKMLKNILLIATKLIL